MHNLQWHEWEREVIDLIIMRFDVPNGDAQGIFEVKEAEMQEVWYQNEMTPEQAFKYYFEPL